MGQGQAALQEPAADPTFSASRNRSPEGQGAFPGPPGPRATAQARKRKASLTAVKTVGHPVMVRGWSDAAKPSSPQPYCTGAPGMVLLNSDCWGVAEEAAKCPGLCCLWQARCVATCSRSLVITDLPSFYFLLQRICVICSFSHNCPFHPGFHIHRYKAAHRMRL